MFIRLKRPGRVRLATAGALLALVLVLAGAVSSQPIQQFLGNTFVRGRLTAATFLISRHVHAAQTVQTVAAGATIALTPGKGFYPVIGTPGAVTTSTTTAIAAGTVIGEEIMIEGTDGTATVTVSVNGTSNVKAVNGQTGRVLALQDTLTVVWDGTNWVEKTFNNNL